MKYCSLCDNEAVCYVEKTDGPLTWLCQTCEDAFSLGQLYCDADVCPAETSTQLSHVVDSQYRELDY